MALRSRSRKFAEGRIMTQSLLGKAAVVTGAAGNGMGRSIAFLCSESGNFISGAVLPYMYR